MPPALPLLLILLFATPTQSIDLTQMKPSSIKEIELQAFSKTVENALINLNLQEKESIVIHILGASNVENEVNWNPLCEKYHASFVLIGPNLDSDLDLDLGDESCVTRVKSLYGREALRLALGKTKPHLVSPDLIVGHNLDIYMIYWRRTLAELLQMCKPVVVTMYCSYEGHKLVRLLKWKEQEFSAASFAECDRRLKMNQNAHVSEDVGTVGVIPDILTLWKFQENPHAHAKPKNCYAKDIMEGTDHGVRNSFWFAFQGKGQDGKGGDSEL